MTYTIKVNILFVINDLSKKEEKLTVSDIHTHVMKLHINIINETRGMELRIAWH